MSFLEKIKALEAKASCAVDSLSISSVANELTSLLAEAQQDVPIVQAGIDTITHTIKSLIVLFTPAANQGAK